MARSIVLFVDDEPLLGEIFQNYLEETDFEVFTFTQQSEALRFIARSSPQWVFVDQHMPEKKGLDFLSSFPSRAFQSVLVTGDAFQVDDLSQSFVDHVLEKPLSSEDVLAILNSN